MIPYFCVTLLWNCMTGLSTSLNRHLNMVSIGYVGVDNATNLLMTLLGLGYLCNIDRLAFYGSLYHSTRTLTGFVRRFERHHQLWILCIAVDVLFIPPIRSRKTCLWSAAFAEKEIRLMYLSPFPWMIFATSTGNRNCIISSLVIVLYSTNISLCKWFYATSINTIPVIPIGYLVPS